MAQKKAVGLPDLSEKLLSPEAKEPKSIILEADELWSFVGKKENKVWVWIVLCRKTWQVIAYVIGDRSEVTCQKLWDAVSQAYSSEHCYTDFWSAYQAVIPKKQHTALGKETGETAHVERWNNTLKQHDAAFCQENALILQFHSYALYMPEPLSPSLQLGAG